MNIEKTVIDSSKGEVTLYKLTNSSGAWITLSSIGAGIVSVVVPDKHGNLDDVVLGYGNIADYLYDGPCAGKIAGRYANRIAGGRFSIDGEEYRLAINCGPNALHGGPEGFQNRLWNSHIDGDKVVFSRISSDGEEGYPGTLAVTIEYGWSDECDLSIVMKAVTDKKTVVNLTNHAYFNLDGENSGSVLKHGLWLGCSKYLPTDDTLVPDGAIADVTGTPMDFTSAKALGRDIDTDFPALIYGKGYDNCWSVDNWQKGQLKTVARLYGNKSGRVMEVSTTQPAVQVYTGNWLSDSPCNKAGGHYCDYDGVAIECQAMPDAPNKPMFPSTLLVPGEEYNETIIFTFKLDSKR